MNKKSNFFRIVIHAGVEKTHSKNLSKEIKDKYNNKLKQSLMKAHNVLSKNGSCIDAVIEAIILLEDYPLFNAGKGAAFNSIGSHELDASIMEGKNLNVGAVTGLTNIKNPIILARKVMETPKLVMLSGKGAQEFAKTQNIEFVKTDYFDTEHRLKLLELAKQGKKEIIYDLSSSNSNQNSANNKKSGNKKSDDQESAKQETGTVGAIALDKFGNLAAGTSTGGLTNSTFSRVSDSSIIGAGNYADNNSAAISATGIGEYFIRLSIAKDIASLVEYKNLSIKKAANLVIQKKLKSLNGWGGVICIDKNGNIAIEHNTPGIRSGYVFEDGKVEIYN